jgi:hypothetical protein
MEEYFEGLTFPLKAALFAWSATLEKILTKSNLRKQYSIVIDVVLCAGGRGGVRGPSSPPL